MFTCYLWRSRGQNLESTKVTVYSQRHHSYTASSKRGRRAFPLVKICVLYADASGHSPLTRSTDGHRPRNTKHSLNQREASLWLTFFLSYLKQHQKSDNEDVRQASEEYHDQVPYWRAKLAIWNAEVYHGRLFPALRKTSVTNDHLGTGLLMVKFHNNWQMRRGSWVRFRCLHYSN